MNTFEQQTEQFRRKNLAESQETRAEAKEKQVEEAEKKMAAKERVEVVSREVKNTKQQIQNIVANMAQVVKAVAAIRAQLGLVSDSAIPSVEQDEKVLEALRKKLDGLYGEINDLRGALLAEERKSVLEEQPNLSVAVLEEEAGRRVQEVLARLGLHGN